LRVTAAVHRFITYLRKYEKRKATNREPRTVNPEPEYEEDNNENKKTIYARLQVLYGPARNLISPFGISGIVGPNGCGKSNIVDAIRWCMGEQSPKQLRGRRMEDVIFSGAGNYKPLGMAEVSIVLENGNGTFPPAFAQNAELSVTRRLYRSGESEYLINRVPCRLKDIQEIFMDTGLGSKAYSIIGQGQISSIIEQKPEETRVMLEEAAGVTKYRRKVEASQRKIELTEANLQRVEDILGEVQRQKTFWEKSKDRLDLLRDRLPRPNVITIFARIFKTWNSPCMPTIIIN